MLGLQLVKSEAEMDKTVRLDKPPNRFQVFWQAFCQICKVLTGRYQVVMVNLARIYDDAGKLQVNSEVHGFSSGPLHGIKIVVHELNDRWLRTSSKPGPDPCRAIR
jgi:hypothetical protein